MFAKTMYEHTERNMDEFILSIAILAAVVYAAIIAIALWRQHKRQKEMATEIEMQRIDEKHRKVFGDTQ